MRASRASASPDLAVGTRTDRGRNERKRRREQYPETKDPIFRVFFKNLQSNQCGSIFNKRESEEKLGFSDSSLCKKRRRRPNASRNVKGASIMTRGGERRPANLGHFQRSQVRAFPFSPWTGLLNDKARKGAGGDGGRRAIKKVHLLPCSSATSCCCCYSCCSASAALRPPLTRSPRTGKRGERKRNIKPPRSSGCRGGI